jgi:hypothetical protein
MSRSRQRVCLQDGQRLDINALLRSGTMPRPANGEKAGSLRVSYPTIGFVQEIRFTSQPRRCGGRQFFFVCPVTGRLCPVLWKPPGAAQFACRQAWGGQVAYQSQFLAKAERCHLAKEKIRARLRDIGGWREPEGWIDMLPRPKRMRAATYARWEGRFDLQDKKLDEAFLEAFQTRWSRLKGLA